MANPVLVIVGTYVGGRGVAQSQFATFSFVNTGGFEAYVPIEVLNPGTTSISAGAEVTIYRSTDGGTNYETDGTVGVVFSKPTAASQRQRNAVILGIGQFLIAVQVGGGSAATWSASLGTAEVVSAFI